MKTTTLTPPTAKSAVKAVPIGMHTVTPYLICDGAAEAIDFYTRAFGASEMMRIPTPNGKIMHASVRIGDSIIMLNDEFPDMNCLGPKSRGGSSVMIHLYVEDVDAAFARAVDAGATVKLPLQDMFWGDRYGQLEDPFGHAWSMASHQRDLTPAEIQEAAKAACCG
jgi:uncharacterized glyoxalase superfamily protein PhnB